MIKEALQSAIGRGEQDTTTSKPADGSGEEPAFARSVSDPSIPDAASLVTPVPPEVIKTASESTPNAGSDRSLPKLLDGVQKLIESYEYQDRVGNAYYEVLAEQFADPHSLRRPIRANGRELTFVVLAEGVAELGDELGMNEREMKSVQIAHQLYAEQLGYTSAAEQVSVLTIEMSEERVDDILRIGGFSDEYSA